MGPEFRKNRRDFADKSKVDRAFDAGEEIVHRTGELIGTVIQKSGEGLEWSMKKTWEGYDKSAKILHEHLGMKLLTSWEPVYYNQGVPKEIEKSVGVVGVSLPFKLNGKYYPATKVSGEVRKLLFGEVYDTDPDFPQVIMQYEDPHPDMIGDEVLRLYPTNRAMKALDLSKGGIVWRMWMPGTEKIAIDAGGKVVYKEQAEMTANDVVQMLITATAEKPTKNGNELVIHPTHLHSALRMITEKSPQLNERWKLLDERLKFSNYLMKDRHRVLFNLIPVIYMEEGDISTLLVNIKEGNIQNWGDLNTAVDELHARNRLMIHPGGANPSTAMAVTSASSTAVTDMDERLRKIPPSLFLSYRGLKYFNTLMEEQEKRLDPKMIEYAKKVVDTQEAMADYQIKFIQTRLKAWEAASDQLLKASGQLESGVRSKVSSEVNALKGEIEGQISSTTNAKNLIEDEALRRSNRIPQPKLNKPRLQKPFQLRNKDRRPTYHPIPEEDEFEDIDEAGL